MTKAEMNRIDKRINAAYRAVGDGIVIDMMDIPKLFNFVRPIVVVGVTDDELKGIVAGFLATIRKN